MDEETKNIAILGSTGSIGTNALRVVRRHRDRFNVVALAAHRNVELLAQQAEEFDVPLIAAYDPEAAAAVQKLLPNRKVVPGVEGLKAVATAEDALLVLQAIAGTRGLVPTFAAVDAGKTVALANKESLVSGGAVVMELARQRGSTILPVDSEHSAIFQCLQGQPHNRLARIILTASGGPFRNRTADELAAVTVDQALQHPSWSMGAKITVDCSTLMNKGLEMIEAHWLFGLPPSQIDVIIHPQSIVHSFVEFVDGSLLAQVGEPSMVVPIQYALTYPDRLPGLLEPFDFTKANTLQFFQPDTDRFRCLQLAYDAIAAGGSLACYMNAANEVLVDGFLNRKLGWCEIGQRLDTLMNKHDSQELTSLDDILEVDAIARDEAAPLAS